MTGYSTSSGKVVRPARAAGYQAKPRPASPIRPCQAPAQGQAGGPAIGEAAGGQGFVFNDEGAEGHVD